MKTPTETLDTPEATAAGIILGAFGLTTLTGEIWTIPGTIMGVPLNAVAGVLLLVMGLWFAFPRHTKRFFKAIGRLRTVFQRGGS